MLLLLVTLLPVPARAAVQDSLAVERQVYTYLTEEMEFNSAAACGVLANIEYESAFQLTVLGDGGTSFGLCQWHAGRYTMLRNYCQSRNLDYRTVQGQMEFLRYELGSTYNALLTALRTVENSRDGAYRAGWLWCTQFERPADMERKAVTRGNTARYKYWNRYNGLLAEEEEKVPELPPEQILVILKQEAVELPLPPEDPERHVPRHYRPEPAQMELYVPRHLPRQEQEEAGFPYMSLAAAVLFLGIGGSWAILRLPNPLRRKKEIPAA